MEHSSIQLHDLPDEIIMIIFKKLDNCALLYSLIGVNKRLDSIVNDSTFTRNITLRTPFYDLNQFTDKILDRFCFDILPKISDKVERLNVDWSSTERVLLAANYPNLYELGLYDLASETLEDFLTNRSYLFRGFQNQISSLTVINLNYHVQKGLFGSPKITNLFIFTRICTVFKNLEYLNFSLFSQHQRLTFGGRFSDEFSSNLLELHIVINNIEDCLCILDGHLNKLHTFYVMIRPGGIRNWSTICNKKKLSNLKGFSLIHEDALICYKHEFIPLFQRMSNLEELALDFMNINESIIDGYNLENNIINHMIKLNKFSFNIRSIVALKNAANLPSNIDIQNTFANFNNQIISSVDSFSNRNQFHCHIYSYPYTPTFYFHISNNFPGGLFKCVREISLYDEHPFEYEFFVRIAESFPFMKKLCLLNRKPQQNDNQQRSIIEYPRLTELDLGESHKNYVEQFLNNTKTCLSNNVTLHVCYDSLQQSTNDFISEVTKVNCSKIIGLKLYNKLQAGPISIYIKEYFPNAEMY